MQEKRLTKGAGSLGGTLRKLRVLAGLTQKEFAERLEVDPSYVSRLERGEREPSLDLLRRAARELELPSGLLMALAVWTDLPEGERSKYGPVIGELLELTGLFQTTLPFGGDGGEEDEGPGGTE